MKNNNDLFIYGKHPVLLALKHNKRKIYKIYTSNVKELEEYLKKEKIKVQKGLIEFKNNNEIARIIKEDVNHQGYLASVSNHFSYDFDDFLSKECKDKNNLPKLLILDQLTDPHNIGAIIRSAVAFGVKYIITTERNTPKDSGIIVKSSAGMSEMIDIIEVVNVNNTIEKLKKVGYFVVGMAGEGKENIKNLKGDFYCLIVGNEGNGIRQLVKKNCDILCKIEMENNVESLNVSVATAIACYQLWSK